MNWLQKLFAGKLIASLEAEIQSKERTIDALQKRIDDSKSTYSSTLEGWKKFYEKELETQRATLNTAHTRVSELEQKIAHLERSTKVPAKRPAVRKKSQN